jgi:hypothetical protein
MALLRKALIITNPGEPGAENYCEGVNKDAQIYRSFLLSAFGGAWNSIEVSTLNRPSHRDATDAVAGIRDADYSLVVFCEHGYYSSRKDTTLLELEAGVDLDAVELRQGARKRTIIHDCCRVVAKEIALDEMAKRSFAAKADSTVDPYRSRIAFDKEIEACSSGDDSQRGGVYSYNLIDMAKIWAQDNTTDRTRYYDALSVVAAHEQAATRVRRATGGTQAPTLQKPMSQPYFPLAVFA